MCLCICLNLNPRPSLLSMFSIINPRIFVKSPVQGSAFLYFGYGETEAQKLAKGHTVSKKNKDMK